VGFGTPRRDRRTLALGPGLRRGDLATTQSPSRAAEKPKRERPISGTFLVIATDPSKGMEGSNLSGREIASVDSNGLAPSQ